MLCSIPPSTNTSKSETADSWRKWIEDSGYKHFYFKKVSKV